MNPTERADDPAATPISKRFVTVIVHIASDWAVAEAGVRSALEQVRSTGHRVILINDAAPDAEVIDHRVRELIVGLSHVEYVRNRVALGFARACDSAMAESDDRTNDLLFISADVQLTDGAIDELLGVLHAAEQHGVVFPRSNGAGIAAMPQFHRREPRGTGTEPTSALRAFTLVSSLLPRWYVSPTGSGECFLIRRELIENHGPLDQSLGFEPGGSNFSIRVNALGYSTLIANGVFVPRTTESSALSSASQSRADADAIDRFRYLADALEDFELFGYSAADVFAEVASDTQTRSILIDLANLSAINNGSNRYALSVLAELATAQLPENVTVTIAAKPDAIDALDLNQYGFRTVPYGSDDHIYDLGIALAPATTIDQLIHLNQHCARWVTCHFDMISSRSWQLMLTNPLRAIVVEDSFRYADRIVSLSAFSLRDAAAVYPHLREIIEERGEPVLLGSTWGPGASAPEDGAEATPAASVPSPGIHGSYVVIMGNFYPHKQVAKAITALHPVDVSIVAFGPVVGVQASERLTIVESGTLPDSDLRSLIEGASLVVFPSAYEGYGLPVADALDAGVPVVAFDTSVSREIVDDLGASAAVRYFRRFTELAQVVSDAILDDALHESAAQLRGGVRGLAPHAVRLLEIVSKELNEPIDWSRLDARFTAVKRLERVARQERMLNADRAALAASTHEVQALLSSESFRLGHAIVRLVHPFRRLLQKITSTR